MKKIKYLVMAFAAVCFTAGLTSCEKEKEVEKLVEVPVEVVKTDTIKVPVEVPQDNNWSRYQTIVTQTVKDNKKHDKVILLVAFGSTWEQAFNTFDGTIKAYEESFKDYDIFLSYSSAICINRAAAGENTDPRTTMHLLSGSMPLLTTKCSTKRSSFSHYRLSLVRSIPV